MHEVNRLGCRVFVLCFGLGNMAAMPTVKYAVADPVGLDACPGVEPLVNNDAGNSSRCKKRHIASRR
jgi:hypothetical protein